MKKIGAVVILIIMIVFSQHNFLHANSYEGQETYYLQYCAQPRANEKEARECANFRNYYVEQVNALSAEVTTLNEEILSVQDDMLQLSDLMKQLQGKLDVLKEQISNKKSLIDDMELSIQEMDDQIVTIGNDVKERDLLMKNRMVSEQVTLGTAQYIDFLMGATDFTDLFRVVEGLQRIHESDQLMMSKLAEQRETLMFKVSEQDRLVEEQENAKVLLEGQQKLEQSVQDQRKIIYTRYQAQEADLASQARLLQNEVEVQYDKVMHIDTSVAEVKQPITITRNEAWKMHATGVISAHTFAYPNGGLHLGLDIACNIGMELRAPVSAIVLYADNPAPTNSGYYYVSIADYNNPYAGRPAGGGNTVHMITQVNGITYGLSFFHLAQEDFIAYPGMQLEQGELFGYVGNSGNTTGPHSHIEIINLGNLSLEAAIEQFSASNADFSWGTNWNTTASSCNENGRVAPCRERPEEILPISE